MRPPKPPRRVVAVLLLPIALLPAALLLATPARAGPPFLTDDPEPTDTGHWEIYGPLAEASGRGAEFDGDIGAELNYGAAPDLQLSLAVPVSFSHDASGWRFGRGDLNVSAKYRFIHDKAAHLSVAAFPALGLPTSSRLLGSHHVTAFFPVWAQKDVRTWSVFGGGGYALNPGAGNRSFWTGGLAVTRQLSSRLLLGVEVDRQGRDTIGGRASTSPGVGFIRTLGGPFRVLASGGPTFSDGRRTPGFHGYAALGVNF